MTIKDKRLGIELFAISLATFLFAGCSTLCNVADSAKTIAEKPIANVEEVKKEIDSVKPINGDLIKVNVNYAKSPVEYKVGEVVDLKISLDTNGQAIPENYTLSCKIDKDFGKAEEVAVSAKDGVLPLSITLDKPGFVRLRVYLKDANGKAITRVQEYWGSKKNVSELYDSSVGFSVADIKQAIDEPADFDEFWNGQKEKFAAVRMEVLEKTFLKKSNGFDVYKVKVACAGPRPVTGFLVVPENAEEKSCPVKVTLKGYGYGGATDIPDWETPNKIVFSINAHGFELMASSEYYSEFRESIKSNGYEYAQDPAQNSDPEAAYFNGMVARLLRALEYVKSLPEWNGKDLIVEGGSQGGLQAAWAAALDSDVSECFSNITWCCDLYARTAGRIHGWAPQWVPALGYYDAVNHAKRIKCKVVINRAGLGDYTCPPASLAVFFNNISSTQKTIVWYEDSTHGFVPKAGKTYAY